MRKVIALQHQQETGTHGDDVAHENPPFYSIFTKCRERDGGRRNPAPRAP